MKYCWKNYEFIKQKCKIVFKVLKEFRFFFMMFVLFSKSMSMFSSFNSTCLANFFLMFLLIFGLHKFIFLILMFAILLVENKLLLMICFHRLAIIDDIEQCENRDLNDIINANLNISRIFLVIKRPDILLNINYSQHFLNIIVSLFIIRRFANIRMGKS